MAPQRKGSWKHDGSLVEAVEAAAVSKKRGRRQLERRHTDQQVDRCLAEHFRGWTHIETHGTVVDGLSLVDRIKADKKQAKDRGSRLSSTYWVDLLEKSGGQAMLRPDW